MCNKTPGAQGADDSPKWVAVLGDIVLGRLDQRVDQNTGRLVIVDRSLSRIVLAWGSEPMGDFEKKQRDTDQSQIRRDLGDMNR